MLGIKQARRVVVAVIGTTVLLFGVALIVLPGPAFVVIPAGLAILSTEFVWAARLSKKVMENAESAAQSVLGEKSSKSLASFWARVTSWFVSKPIRPERPIN